MNGDWSTITALGSTAPAIGKVFLALQEGRDPSRILGDARRIIGQTIASSGYSRTYHAVFELHLLREIELVIEASLKLAPGHINSQVIAKDAMNKLTDTLDQRFNALMPIFRYQEEALALRRAIFTLVGTSRSAPQVGSAWIHSAKIARKAGYEQTAYSAILQAQETEAPFAFVERAKLARPRAGAWKAFTDLENMAQPVLDSGRRHGDAGEVKSLAKASFFECTMQSHG